MARLMMKMPVSSAWLIGWALEPASCLGYLFVT